MISTSLREENGKMMMMIMMMMMVMMMVMTMAGTHAILESP